jgi:hypothetical protein
VEVENLLQIAMHILYINQINKIKEENFQTEEDRWEGLKVLHNQKEILKNMELNKITVL